MTNNTYNFEAETGKVLELLTHSVYSNREVFLRELISNCSDAIDKARIKSLTDVNYLWDDSEFKITIDIDKNEKTLIITDNGIWMSRDEVIKNIWTIAKSWTKDFIEKLKQSKENTDSNLIGQFGIGFYSSFIVAFKVELETKSNESSEWVKWISDWKWTFTIEESTKTTRWTIIKLFINEENQEFLEDWKIRELIKKYSNYVWVPIMMKELDTRNDEEKQKEPKVLNYEQINQTKAIWTKNKSEVKQEEYDEFYSSLSYDFNKPLGQIHLNTEWVISYKSILFIPEKLNMFNTFADATKDYGPKLYTRNVLILENAKELMPVWLRFVTWVVETSDLPLNISREVLQSNTVLEKIKTSLTKKVISKLKELNKEDKTKFDEFFKNYWKILKEWIYYDAELKESIAEVVKFNSNSKNDLITLDEYVENLVDNEKKEIYYLTWASKTEILANPYLEQFTKKWIDVLLLDDPIDVFIMQNLTEYKEFKFKIITDSSIELDSENEEEKKQKEEKQKEFKDMLELMKNTIWTDKLEQVKLTTRLWNSLWALTTKQGWITPQMEKMYKAMWQAIPTVARTLELNSSSQIVEKMLSEFKNDIKSEKLKEMMIYTYEQAILAEWWDIEDMSWFLQRVNKFANSYL